MKLTDLEAERPYEDIITLLINPNVSRSVLRDDSLRKTARLPLPSLLNRLRERQRRNLAQFAVSSLIDSQSSRRNEELVYILNSPGKVAALFVGELLREVRVSGLRAPTADNEADVLSPADRTFVNVLRWMGEMDTLPKARRRPLELGIEPLNAFTTPVEWGAIAGPVLDGFLIFYFNSHFGLAQRDLKQQARSTIGALLSTERARIGIKWSWTFIEAGAKQLDRLSGGQTLVAR